jgi:type VI secretion system protein ImpI
MTLSLILEVPGPQGQGLAEARRKVFGHAGGRIGRASDCDWVLSSDYVSRHHATVSFADGAFHITSVSENGIAINDATVQLPRFESRALTTGDRLFIDEYEITVAISEASESSEPPVDNDATARVRALPLLHAPGLPFDMSAFLRGAGWTRKPSRRRWLPSSGRSCVVLPRE